VALLGSRYPQRFPTREDFEDARRRNPQPVLSWEEYRNLGGLKDSPGPLVNGGPGSFSFEGLGPFLL